MRIISGIRRGHKLLEFEGDDVRPTTDRVKESIFNIIQGYVPDAICLDMFGGSGALSFEAISRGAKKAVIIEKDKRSVDIIKKNATSLKFLDSCEIVNGSCLDYVGQTKEKFDIIFLDPPYNKNFIETVLLEIIKNDVLNEDGIIMLESDDIDFHGEFDGLEIYRQKRYGRTYITIYKQLSDKKEESK